MKGSWKTTALGICVLLSAVGTAGKALLDGDSTTAVDINSVIAALTGLGLILARDDNKTSKDVGAE
jgi:hypothetical protein